MRNDVANPQGTALLSVAAEGPSELAGARELAKRLRVPLREPGDAHGGLELLVTPGGLALREEGGPLVRVDGEALAKPRPGRDPLARAVRGTRTRGEPLEVIDCTAGLGADAFHLAASGFQVVMVEREPALAALLEDALTRARGGAYGESAKAAATRLTLVVQDAVDYLRTRREAGQLPQVAYLDPMYPDRGKAALPGKGMALLRGALRGSDNAAELLTAALSTVEHRVVVKRPLKAPPLGSRQPSGTLRGATTRYDLYAPTPPR